MSALNIDDIFPPNYFVTGENETPPAQQGRLDDSKSGVTHFEGTPSRLEGALSPGHESLLAVP